MRRHSLFIFSPTTTNQLRSSELSWRNGGYRKAARWANNTNQIDNPVHIQSSTAFIPAKKSSQGERQACQTLYIKSNNFWNIFMTIILQGVRFQEIQEHSESAFNVTFTFLCFMVQNWKGILYWFQCAVLILGKIISSLVRLMSDFKVAFEKIVTIKQQIQPILMSSYIILCRK